MWAETAYSNIRGTPNSAKSEVQKRPETHTFPRMALTRAVQRQVDDSDPICESGAIYRYLGEL
jgi:hypothetical protein